MTKIMPNDNAENAVPEVVVAGHICLDIIPTITGKYASIDALMIPGRLVNTGRVVMATGGAVSNTGLALHHLGITTRLMGKVGDDLLGRSILDVLRGFDEQLAHGMVVSKGEDSSYSVVISPPGIDRIFLHCPGANDTFAAEDIDYDKLAGARLFHFGYPPLMARMNAHNGHQLARMFKRVKEQGLTTSLDMTMPDPQSASGRIDWTALLRNTLPHVDIFLPSIEEILFMLRRDTFDELNARAGAAGILPLVTASLLADVSDTLLRMGAMIVGLKMGDQGMYLRTAEASRFAIATAADAAAGLPRSRQLNAAAAGASAQSAAGAEANKQAPTDGGGLFKGSGLASLSLGLGAGAPAGGAEAWVGRELWAPCFQARQVVGTTGSGDCTIAGFLAGLLKGLGPAETLTGAVAVGACNVEVADAVSGIVPWDQVQQRIVAGWERRPIEIDLTGWNKHKTHDLWVGPNDMF